MEGGCIMLIVDVSGAVCGNMYARIMSYHVHEILMYALKQSNFQYFIIRVIIQILNYLIIYL